MRVSPSASTGNNSLAVDVVAAAAAAAAVPLFTNQSEFRWP